MYSKWCYLYYTYRKIAQLSFAAHHSQAHANSPQEQICCPEDNAYVTASNTLNMSTQAIVTCQGNIAYATVAEESEDITATTNNSSPIYDEVTID